MKTIKIAIAVTILASTAVAHAGEFNAETYGNVTASDFSDVVTEAFTRKFPSKKWSIFVWTASGITDRGIPYCSAAAGVVPRHSGMFPVSRYESTRFDPSQVGSNTVGERRQWAVACARDSVTNLMSDDLDKVYEAYKPSR